VAARDGSVLAVDLDGTLLKTDTLIEGLLILLRERPFDLFRAALTLPRGRAALKSFVTDHASLDIASLPLNMPLVEWLEAERATGRYLVLVTAADHRIADAVAERIGLFDEVLASDGRLNLKGEHKADALIARFGQGGFDYVGDARADRPVWRAAGNAIVVGGPRILETARQVAEVERVFQPDSGLLPASLRALRLHQWVKNLLIFLPLLAAHRIFELPSLMAAALAFLAFGLTASAVYLLNDLLDLSADRRHPSKSRRPFASGDLPIVQGSR
jgi:phosphoserine phosphatase